MDIPVPPHVWDVTPQAAIGVQKALAGRIRTDVHMPLESVRLVGGVDVSAVRDDPLLTAGAVIWDRLSGEVVETASAQANGTFPYVPGLLSFREIPVLLQALAFLQHEPDIFLVDGHGIAHPRRLGIAAHIGLLMDRPTVGVAKSRLVGTFDEPGGRAGDRAPLMDRGENIGTVLRTKERSNPVFVSPGHRIDRESADAIVLACLRGYRLPEPTRLAHRFVNDVRTGVILQPT